MSGCLISNWKHLHDIYDYSSVDLVEGITTHATSEKQMFKILQCYQKGSSVAFKATRYKVCNWADRCRAQHVLFIVQALRIYQQSYLISRWCHQMKSFRVTGPLCREFIGHRWIPLTKASDAELWWFLRSAPKQTVEKTLEKLLIPDAITSIMMSL